MLLSPGTNYIIDGVQHQIPATEEFKGKIPKLTEKKKIFLTEIKRILHYFHNQCEDLSIPYYICCGTLLGALKVEGILPWDTDADVSVNRADARKIEEAFNSSDCPYKLIPFRYGYKLCTRTLLGYPFVDIMIVDLLPKELSSSDEPVYSFCYPIKRGKPSFELLWFFNKKKHPQNVVFPLRKYTFEGMELWGPNDGYEVCRLNYGEKCFYQSFVKFFDKHWITALIRM